MMGNFRTYLVTIAAAMVLCSATPLGAEGEKAEKGIKVGDSFADFKLPSVDGKLIKTEALRRDKVLILEFTTSWCKDCASQLKEMQALAGRVESEKVQIIEVNVLSQIEHIRIELKEQKRKHEYPVLVDNDIDADKRVASKFFVEKSPTIFIVDPAGKIRFIGHMVPCKEMEKIIDEILEEEKRKNGSENAESR